MALMSFTEPQGKILLDVAKASIEHGLAHRSPLTVNPLDYPPPLREVRASFVTLTIHHQLRGCIGTLTAIRPLISDVAYHAHAAAFSDPRFAPLQHSELRHLEIHISVLSLPAPLHFTSEADLLHQLRPGIDGLILKDGPHIGTFLPSVWESLPNPRDFLQHLKQKAGLSPTYWSNTLTIQRYTTESIE